MAVINGKIPKEILDYWDNIKVGEWIPYKPVLDRPGYIYNKEKRTIEMSEINNPKNYNAPNIKPKNSDTLNRACAAMFNSRKLRPNDWGKVE